MAANVVQVGMLEVGTDVEVFSTYRRVWVQGFEIAGVLGDRYALRRCSDRAVLGGTFRVRHVRARRPGLG